MRIDPISIILNEDFKIDKKIYFISGNEKSLMQKIKATIIEKYQKNTNARITNIDTVKDFVEEVGLFEDHKIFLGNGCKGIDEKNLENIKSSNGVFIFVNENSQKIKKIKSLFNKDIDSYLIDCYELEGESKTKILKKFLSDNNLNISQDVFWLLVDKLDSKYSFFENSLNQIVELDGKDLTIGNVKKLLTISDTGKERIFFNLLKKNREIVNLYRNKIVTNTDVSEFYFYIKFLCQLIIESKNEYEYQKKIPVYLFKEKHRLIEIFRKYNSRKKKLLIRLLASTENVLRKNNGLSLVFGLRFLLNIKKITIS
ncbi:hypothetical protein OA415_01860 [Pelagibacteraceae bacterium]|nr:hypothetical protein [Pelagibacteraceae bacterium]